ncbi:aminoglycoside phosphotransferase family protein [Dactylosporangium sp. NPDC005572]|uniref:aminoglycoside phosphotransferase family protein n=1 Tax=Dactylosporangium sp. NPDC005572 TaxID=3156889 RepID=UPI0033BEB992
MHDGEVPTDALLVRLLLAEQFPAWADLPVTPVESGGTDNAIYRLGDDLAVRLPRIGWATGQIALERTWLPVLAPQLPVAVPAPLAVGVPAFGYPYEWAVYRWLPGVNPGEVPARDLADFVVALRGVDAVGGPPARGRGAPLDATAVPAPIQELAGEYDVALLTDVWRADAAAAPWGGPPTWLHGDLHGGNVLVDGGRLSAVIDWSCLAVGDPAIDLLPAWSLLSAADRPAFREQVGADEAQWRRGRCWALTMAVNALPYYRDTNPFLAGLGRRMIAEVLADVAG